MRSECVFSFGYTQFSVVWCRWGPQSLLWFLDQNKSDRACVLWRRLFRTSRGHVKGVKLLAYHSRVLNPLLLSSPSPLAHPSLLCSLFLLRWPTVPQPPSLVDTLITSVRFPMKQPFIKDRRHLCPNSSSGRRLPWWYRMTTSSQKWACECWVTNVRVLSADNDQCMYSNSHVNVMWQSCDQCPLKIKMHSFRE